MLWCEWCSEKASLSLSPSLLSVISFLDNVENQLTFLKGSALFANLPQLQGEERHQVTPY